MLYEVVINDWGETTYVPTIWGNALLIFVILALLAAAVFAARRAKSEVADTFGAVPDTSGQEAPTKRSAIPIRQLTFCAMCIALGSILSEIKLLHLPTGGSITLLSMLVICLPGYFYGLGTGLLTCTAYGIFQLLLGPYVLYPMQLVVDYILAFGALGLSGLFANAKHGLIKGYLTAVLGRYVFAVLSGWLFFGAYAWEGWNPLPYSLLYNGIYLFSEALLTVLVLCLPPVQKGILRIKSMTLS